MLPWWPMLPRALLPALTVAVVTVASAGCLSPTLPLPPPEISSISQASTAGSWIISGDCTAGAIVVVLDTNTGEGVVFEDLHSTGFFTVTIEGSACDTVQPSNWEEDDSQDFLSTGQTLQLEATVDGEPTNPNGCGQ